MGLLHSVFTGLGVALVVSGLVWVIFGPQEVLLLNIGFVVAGIMVLVCAFLF